jgi:hypothetical protein
VSLSDPARAIPLSSMPCPLCDCTGTVQASAALGSPVPGDLVICLACGGVCIVTPAQRLRGFMLADLEHYHVETLRAVVQTVIALHRSYAQKN